MNPLEDNHEINKQLFRNANLANWYEVIETYRKHPPTHVTEVTSSGDTALHVAISNGLERVVEELVSIVSKTPKRPALVKGNGLGNTPLHLAAYVGSARMCHILATLDNELIGIRNDDNETPFFVAVRYGHKEAFLVLNSFCGYVEGYRYCRGKDGDTILHSAILGEHFDLAFNIMNLYEKLVNAVNEHGFSPLHILANKPEAFESGNHFRGCHKLIYHCISVDELQLEPISITRDANLEYEERSPVYPINYHTCLGMLSLIRNVIRALLRLDHSSEKNDEESYVEDKQPHRQNEEHPRALKRMAQGVLPINYTTIFNFVKIILKVMLVFFSLGFISAKRMRVKKAKHIWSVQIMEKLLDHSPVYDYKYNGMMPDIMVKKVRESSESIDRVDPINDPPRWVATEGVETPILIAAKNGVVEMVEGILKRFPEAVLDENHEEKNIVLLAVEHRQPLMYKFLLGQKGAIFKKTDKDGNSALHLAAKPGKRRPWLIPALQMQWEIKWFEFVRNSMPLNFFPKLNNESETPREIFSKTHSQLAKEGGAWLTSTSQSCSVVAALIVTVAFPTSATLPGGVKSDNSGVPSLGNQAVFSIFAISSLFAFYFSAIAVVMFLALLTSRYEERDFGIDLPRKLLLGLTSLFISIASMLFSFCGGHFFVLKEKLQYAALPMYAIMFLPIAFLTIAQFPFYFDLVWATFNKVPLRSTSSNSKDASVV